MLTAIQFDDQHRIDANKVDDVGPDSFLSAKTRTIQTMGSQFIPDELFYISRVAAK